jgi:hypothetical protein
LRLFCSLRFPERDYVSHGKTSGQRTASPSNQY